MFTKFVRFLCAIIRILIHLFSCKREKVVIYQGSKINNLILISSCGSKRRMRFNHLTNGAQSEIDLNHIDYPSHEYIQLMIISFIYYPIYLTNEKNILIIGLGGGILPRAIRKIDSNCVITIIEIDPVVFEMAKKYFYFKEDSKMKVYICDGKFYLDNLSRNQFYDFIFIDAYDCFGCLPNNMKNDEFLILLKQHLNPNGGFIIFNLVCIYKSYLNIKNKLCSIFGLNHLLTFRSNDFLNIVTVVSTFQLSIENNLNLNLVQQIKDKLSIDFYSLLKTKQEKEISIEINQDELENIDNDEENLSLKQFINLV